MSDTPPQAPSNTWLSTLIGILVLLGVAAAVWVGWDWNERQKARDTAKALCKEWADKLDQQTTDAGIYIRDSGEQLPDDPWGQKLRLSYSQGGIAEMLEVRSLGPDGLPNTDDDLRETRMAANLKGIGTGIKTNTE